MPFNLAARFSMSWLSFSLVIFAYICVVFMLLCPSMELTVSMGTPLERNTVVAAVWRKQWNIQGKASKSEQVKIERKPFEMSYISIFCQMRKMQMGTEY